LVSSEKSSSQKSSEHSASSCLPLPDYKVLSSDSTTAFDDKLLVINKNEPHRRFTSAVFLTDIPELFFLLHTGSPASQQDIAVQA